jgi:CheY-like chemotaxis protein
MATSKASPKECIFAIDDEEAFLRFLKEVLEYLGYRVFTASSPQDAVRFYEEHWREIDLVILDFLLPPLSGDSVFDDLQHLNPDVRVVLLTGCEESVAARLLQKGQRGYLQKPFCIQDLAQTVRDAISAPVLACPASESPA